MVVGCWTQAIANAGHGANPQRRMPGAGRISEMGVLAPIAAIRSAVGSELARAVCRSASKLADLQVPR